MLAALERRSREQDEQWRYRRLPRRHVQRILRHDHRPLARPEDVDSVVVIGIRAVRDLHAHLVGDAAVRLLREWLALTA